jgi:hypothetical protein
MCPFYVWPSQSTTSSIATLVGIGGFEGGLQEEVSQHDMGRDNEGYTRWWRYLSNPATSS